VNPEYRYTLHREWNTLPVFPRIVNFICLNPSTADETTDDPTVRRLISFGKTLGFDGLILTNLFAARSTDPRCLKSFADPVGLRNDFEVMIAGRLSATCVCAWGTHGGYLDRDKAVIEVLQRWGVHLQCLGITKDGFPKHPLYLPGNAQLRPFKDDLFEAERSEKKEQGHGI
jgi:hypothetical protein